MSGTAYERHGLIEPAVPAVAAVEIMRDRLVQSPWLRALVIEAHQEQRPINGSEARGIARNGFERLFNERERERDQHLRIGVLASVAHTRRAALQMLRRSDVSKPIGAATADAGSATRRISSNCSSNLQQPGVNANARVHGGADQEPHRCAGMACWLVSSTTCTTKNCSRQSTTMCRESV